MNRQRALELLTRSKPELQARFGVIRLALFGSTARNSATSGSDVAECHHLSAFSFPWLGPRDPHHHGARIANALHKVILIIMR